MYKPTTDVLEDIEVIRAKLVKAANIYRNQFTHTNDDAQIYLNEQGLSEYVIDKSLSDDLGILVRTPEGKYEAAFGSSDIATPEEVLSRSKSIMESAEGKAVFDHGDVWINRAMEQHPIEHISGYSTGSFYGMHVGAYRNIPSTSFNPPAAFGFVRPTGGVLAPRSTIIRTTSDPISFGYSTRSSRGNVYKSVRAFDDLERGSHDIDNFTREGPRPMNRAERRASLMTALERKLQEINLVNIGRKYESLKQFMRDFGGKFERGNAVLKAWFDGGRRLSKDLYNRLFGPRSRSSIEMDYLDPVHPANIGSSYSDSVDILPEDAALVAARQRIDAKRAVLDAAEANEDLEFLDSAITKAINRKKPSTFAESKEDYSALTDSIDQAIQRKKSASIIEYQNDFADLTSNINQAIHRKTKEASALWDRKFENLSKDTANLTGKQSQMATIDWAETYVNRKAQYTEFVYQVNITKLGREVVRDEWGELVLNGDLGVDSFSVKAWRAAGGEFTRNEMKSLLTGRVAESNAIYDMPTSFLEEIVSRQTASQDTIRRARQEMAWRRLNPSDSGLSDTFITPAEREIRYANRNLSSDIDVVFDQAIQIEKETSGLTKSELDAYVRANRSQREAIKDSLDSLSEANSIEMADMLQNQVEIEPLAPSKPRGGPNQKNLERQVAHSKRRAGVMFDDIERRNLTEAFNIDSWNSIDEQSITIEMANGNYDMVDSTEPISFDDLKVVDERIQNVYDRISSKISTYASDRPEYTSENIMSIIREANQEISEMDSVYDKSINSVAQEIDGERFVDVDKAIEEINSNSRYSKMTAEERETWVKQYIASERSTLDIIPKRESLLDEINMVEDGSWNEHTNRLRARGSTANSVKYKYDVYGDYDFLSGAQSTVPESAGTAVTVPMEDLAPSGRPQRQYGINSFESFDNEVSFNDRSWPMLVDELGPTEVLYPNSQVAYDQQINREHGIDDTMTITELQNMNPEDRDLLFGTDEWFAGSSDVEIRTQSLYERLGRGSSSQNATRWADMDVIDPVSFKASLMANFHPKEIGKGLLAGFVASEVVGIAQDMSGTRLPDWGSDIAIGVLAGGAMGGGWGAVAGAGAMLTYDYTQKGMAAFEDAIGLDNKHVRSLAENVVAGTTSGAVGGFLATAWAGPEVFLPATAIGAGVGALWGIGSFAVQEIMDNSSEIGGWFTDAWDTVSSWF